MIRCAICKRPFTIVTNTHASLHGYTLARYIREFGSEGVGFLSPNLLSKRDPRYRTWRKSLKKRPPPWNSGHTKQTHPSVTKTSATMRRKGIDNFRAWRERVKQLGLWQKWYPPPRQLSPSGDLAEYIGVVLGDGNIHRYARTEGLVISCNSNNQGFISRYARLTKRLFGKTPFVKKVKGKNNVRIRLYQQAIAQRLGVPTGDRGKILVRIPQWIWRSKTASLRLLRGLFEAEGSFSIHLPTSTYNFQFSNKNPSLLNVAERALRMLGYHPEVRSNCVRLRKKAEALAFAKQSKFRVY